jgi:hypothetical protein
VTRLFCKKIIQEIAQRILLPFFFGGGGVSNPLCLSSSLALHFSQLFFLVQHRWGWHLLAHEMASDFTVTCQFSQRELIFFSLRISLNINKIFEKIAQENTRPNGSKSPNLVTLIGCQGKIHSFHEFQLCQKSVQGQHHLLLHNTQNDFLKC